MESKVKKLGQYFTTSTELKEKIFEFILNNPKVVLEPCIGRGDLVSFVSQKKPGIFFDMYEIDDSINLLPGIQRNKVVFGDFIQAEIQEKYHTIIGNPPYVKSSKSNLYIEFTEKCYNILCENGELIFIVPSDFFKLTSSSKLLNSMMEHGSFTHVYHPHNEKLFKDASIDVVVFRYCKNKLLEKKVIYNNGEKFIINNDGFLVFSEEPRDSLNIFKDFFNIYVGIVSGKDEVFKNKELGNIQVIVDENKSEKYVCIEKFPSENDAINTYLSSYKAVLLSRRMKKFTKENWFEWGALRNKRVILENWGKECIYVKNLTRNERVAFTGKVGYFGGNLLLLIPEKSCDLQVVVAYLNSSSFKDNFIFSGRFKIGHRQISNFSIPRSLIM